jgi:hypothetical protein
MNSNEILEDRGEGGRYKFTASKRNVTRKVSKCVTSRGERISRGNVAGLFREE